MKMSRVKEADSDNWKDFLFLYTQTFTEKERTPTSRISKNIEDKTNEVFLAKLDGKAVGYYILAKSQSKEFSLLWYIGVLNLRQGEGIGGTILKHIISDYKKNSNMPLLLLEAEEKQAKWYRKYDFFTIDCDYSYPHFTDSGQTRCSLMVIPKPLSHINIPQATLLNIVNDMYLQMYQLNSGDIRLTKLLDKIEKKEYALL